MPPRKNKRNNTEEEKQEKPEEKLNEEKQKKLDEEEEKNRIATFAKILEDQLVIAAITGSDLIKITHHTIVIIDDVSVDIFVGKEDDKYNYYITNNKLKHSNRSEDDDWDDDIKFIELEDVSTLVELLTHLEEVKKTYRFVEHKLVSPSEYEFAKNQRIFFPIPSDKCCSVCYDPTIEYSICNHPICFKCRIKCIFSNKDSCPICRGEKLSIFPGTLTYTLNL